MNDATNAQQSALLPSITVPTPACSMVESDIRVLHYSSELVR